MSKQEITPIKRMSREDWLSRRRHSIGASDSPAILGVESPAGGPWNVYVSKVEGMQQAEKDEMRAGLIFEPIMRPLLEERICKIIKPSVFAKHKEIDFVAATPDGVLPDAVAEYKRVDPSKRDDWGDEGTDQIPDHVLVQVAHQMAVLDVPVAYVGVLFGVRLPGDFKHYVVERDLALERIILTRIRAFWETHILTKTPPSMVGARDVGDFLARRYPADRRPLAVASDYQGHLIHMLRRATQAVALATAYEERVKNAIKDEIGDQAGLVIDGTKDKVTWKKSKGRKSTRWKALAYRLGATQELVDEYTSRGEGTRVFLRPRSWKREVTGG
jgi:putative phage-type endonuclease